MKELRLANATNADEANAVLEKLLPGHNRRFSKAAREQADAHRPLGPGHDLASILSLQEERKVSNDYTVRYRNRFYQLAKPAYPGLRGGQVVMEERLDGSLAIRFRGRYLKYSEVAAGGSPGGSAPRPPEFNASSADARGGEQESVGPTKGADAPGVQPVGGRSGRTPAEPCPPDDAAKDSAKPKGRPAQDHPWRKPFKRQK